MLQSRRVVFEDMPVLVEGGDEALVLRQLHIVKFKPALCVFGVWVFHGLDRGDIVEMDTEVSASGFQLAIRSDHKETMDSYPAWTYFEHPDIQVKRLRIALLLRVNGFQANAEHPRFDTLTARGHFGLILQTRV